MRRKIRDKIDLLTKLTCWDHHKTKDGYYEISVNYNSFHGDVSWGYDHPGYLFEALERGFKTYNEAEEALEKKLDEKWFDDLKWLEEARTNPEEYDMVWNNAPSVEEIEAMKKKWGELT